MKSDELKKLISQIKKYDLTKSFDSTKEFDKWLSKLNARQIKNFNSLTIDPTSIMFPLKLLRNKNLLNCDDYLKRVEAMLTIKNGEECWHLFDRVCSPNFLNSKNYYEDMEMISKATPSTFRYIMWIIDQDSFIQSKYHKEDLKRIIEAKDTSKRKNDDLVAEALATVASNRASINSPYHQQDMELIAKSGSGCLQRTHCYPEYGLNKLAINKDSLHDNYHLENMKILAQKPIASNYLYRIMTLPSIIKGKNYRDEIKVLKDSKSHLNALAIYCYIVNPQSSESEDLVRGLCIDNSYTQHYDIQRLIRTRQSVQGNLNPKYLEYLTLLSQEDSKKVMYLESVISNKEFLNSPYEKEDLKLLLSIINTTIFKDLYILMTNKASLSGPYHIKDANLIATTTDKNIRELLLRKAINERSINSGYHEYDMQYITKLDLDNIDEKCLTSMYYYLFENGIDHVEHIERLETLYRNETIEDYDPVLEYLNELEKDPKKIKSKVKILPCIKKH